MNEFRILNEDRTKSYMGNFDQIFQGSEKENHIMTTPQPVVLDEVGGQEIELQELDFY